jgi:hypothetical protein
MTARFGHRYTEQSIPTRFGRRCLAGSIRVSVPVLDGACAYEELGAWSSATAARAARKTSPP